MCDWGWNRNAQLKRKGIAEKEPPRKFTVKRVAKQLLQISTRSLKSLRTWTPTPKRFSLIKRNVPDALLLTRTLTIEKETHQANHHEQIS